MAARGKWAQGIEPRNFTWILQGKLAVCERPGGYGANHRKVRRQEEIIWLREQGFTMVVSLAVSPHNLHNYDEMGMPWRHRPFTRSDDQEAYLSRLFPELRHLLLEGGKLVLHQDELGDRLSGLMAAYVLWNRLVPGPPQAISVVEQLLHRQLGPDARSLLTLVPRLPEPGTTPPPADVAPSSDTPVASGDAGDEPAGG
jgi:hypothetical protein